MYPVPIFPLISMLSTVTQVKHLFFTLFIQDTVKVFQFKKKATFKNKFANPSIALRFLLAF